MSTGANEDDNDFDSDDRLADDWESSLADVHPLVAITVVSGLWLIAWTALFGIVEAFLWVSSFFR